MVSGATVSPAVTRVIGIVGAIVVVVRERRVVGDWLAVAGWPSLGVDVASIPRIRRHAYESGGSLVFWIGRIRSELDGDDCFGVSWVIHESPSARLQELGRFYADEFQLCGRGWLSLNGHD